MKHSLHGSVFVCLFVFSLAFVLVDPPTVHAEDTLWITDDVTDMVYQVTLDGALLSSFAVQMSADSEIAVDPSDNTLWAASEGRDGLANFSKSGELLSFIPATTFDSDATAFTTEGVSVAVDSMGESLWVVDDATLTVYNIEKDGTLISSFPTTTYHARATSPQGIAVDPEDGTLWIADNRLDRIDNVNTDGTPTGAAPIDVGDLFGVGNVQGVALAPDGTLWFTARDTSTIYNVDKQGNLLSSFASSTYDPLSVDPTGIAFDPGSTDFVRGDANANGRIDFHDAVMILRYKFSRLRSDPYCIKALDTNDDGRIRFGDSIRILRVLFFGRSIPAPFPDCGADETSDSLECESFPICQ